MCGLNLYFGEGGDDVVRLMNDEMKYRGTRSRQRSYFDGRVHVGNVRLPIQGLDEEWDPPLRYERFEMAMVGEVFNFRDFDPSAENDVKVAVERWAKTGTWSILEYDGFWAMVVVDVLNAEVIVVTDPLAKKPLYYRTHPTVAFSSEIDPLARVGPLTLDERNLSGTMKWGYCHDGTTPYTEIRSMEPGTIMTFDVDGRMIRSTRYEIIQEKHVDLMSAMTTSVRRRLVSDVPVGLLLSGGLDSTIVFEMMKKITTEFTVFHVDNAEATYLDHLKFPAGIRVVPIDLFDQDLEYAIRANQTPVDLGSVLPQYALSRAIFQQGFDVVLSGDGADELFGGYRRATEYDSQRSDVFHELVYYHLPRLDRLMMKWTNELRCPFLSWPIVGHALTLPWTERRRKEHLKTVFKDVVPRPILERAKIPLKTREILKDKMEWRRRVMNVFRDRVAPRTMKKGEPSDGQCERHERPATDG